MREEGEFAGKNRQNPLARAAAAVARRSSEASGPNAGTLAFGIGEAEDSRMTPRAHKGTTAGARRAASAIQGDSANGVSVPELIDRETGVREIIEILEGMIGQAGDLIEQRSPELVAKARAALNRYSDDEPGQAE
jgi:hypothetical protein